MLIRVFSESESGLAKFIQFIRLELGVKQLWDVETCHPMRWLPPTTTATTSTTTQTQQHGDLHIYIGTPVRIAVPWAAFNVFIGDVHGADVSGGAASPWSWVSSEMDMIVPVVALARDRVVKTMRSLLYAVRRNPGVPALPGLNAIGQPKVAIVTLTRNRSEWWANMIQNIVKQDWPLTHLEWIVVDDSEPTKRITSHMAELREKMPSIRVTHVLLDSPTSIGEKRNIGCRAASSDTGIFVMMDDDDHYLPTSVSNRVAWLWPQRVVTKTTHKGGAVSNTLIAYCATLPMYDTLRYISAMNVPPMDAPICHRVSEATLAFTREAWEARPFADVWMSEGEAFIEGREESTVEISPMPILVSLIHSGNTSSRRVPEGQESNGCHFGFSDDYFTYLHEEAK